MSETVPAKTLYRRITWLLALVNLAVPAFILLQRDGSDLSDTANIWVSWISALFVSATLLVSSYLRTPTSDRRIPRRMVLTAVGLVTLSGFITTISISATPSDNYLQVALSDTPLNKIRPERKRIMVELIRRDKAASDENSRLAKSMKPISPALYSVDSFASKSAMESTSSQFKQASDIDSDYVAAKSNALKDFHGEMLKVDPAYLRDFEATLQKKNAVEDALEVTNAKWVSTTLDLYKYAIEHSDQISMSKDGHLTIDDQKVRQNFLKQLDACRSLQDAVSNQREKAVDDQHARQDAEGVQRTD